MHKHFSDSLTEPNGPICYMNLSWVLSHPWDSPALFTYENSQSRLLIKGKIIRCTPCASIFSLYKKRMLFMKMRVDMKTENVSRDPQHYVRSTIRKGRQHSSCSEASPPSDLRDLNHTSCNHWIFHKLGTWLNHQDQEILIESSWNQRELQQRDGGDST